MRWHQPVTEKPEPRIKETKLDRCVKNRSGRPDKADDTSAHFVFVSPTQRGKGTSSPETEPLLSEALHIPPRAGRACSTLRDSVSISAASPRGEVTEPSEATYREWTEGAEPWRASREEATPGCREREEGERTRLGAAAAGFCFLRWRTDLAAR
ncbi:hypothetical protein LEMLEM_LOCUS12869 [Lemmus lemmus]